MSTILAKRPALNFLIIIPILHIHRSHKLSTSINDVLS